MTNKDTRMLMYAFRYALGRMTGAVDDVISSIKENIGNLQQHQIEQIIKEINECPNLGMKCDKHQWLSLVEFLKER